MSASLENPILTSTLTVSETDFGAFNLRLFADVGDGPIQVGAYVVDVKAPLERLARLWEAGAYLPLEKKPLSAEGIERSGGRTYYLSESHDLPLLKPLTRFRQKLDEAEKRIDPTFAPARQTSVTLSNLKVSSRLSEETLAFTATVNIDGKPAFEASNHGTGGCNAYHPLRGREKTFEADLARVDATARDLGFDFEPVDALIAELTGEYEFRKRVLSTIRRGKTIFTVPSDGEGTFRSYDRQFSVSVKQKILTDFPDATILNETIAGETPTDEETYSNRIFRRLKTHTVFESPKGANMREIARPYSAEIAKSVRERYPDAYIINEHFDSSGRPKK